MSLRVLYFFWIDVPSCFRVQEEASPFVRTDWSRQINESGINSLKLRGSRLYHCMSGHRRWYFCFCKHREARVSVFFALTKRKHGGPLRLHNSTQLDHFIVKKFRCSRFNYIAWILLSLHRYSTTWFYSWLWIVLSRIFRMHSKKKSQTLGPG